MSTNILFTHSNSPLVNQATVSLAENVKKHRKRLGLSQAALGREIGVRQNTIQAIEKGETKRTRYLVQLADVFGVEPAELDPTVKSSEKNRPSAASDKVMSQLQRTTGITSGIRDFPIQTSAEGGRGALIVTTEPVEYLVRPDPLANVKDSYGIIVSGDSMVPAFEAGDVALVHPHLPPLPETDIILYKEEADGQVEATIKRLVKVTSTAWVLRQHNPKKEFLLPRSEWVRCHRVIGKYNRR